MSGAPPYKDQAAVLQYVSRLLDEQIEKEVSAATAVPDVDDPEFLAWAAVESWERRGSGILMAKLLRSPDKVPADLWPVIVEMVGPEVWARFCERVSDARPRRRGPRLGRRKPTKFAKPAYDHACSILRETWPGECLEHHREIAREIVRELLELEDTETVVNEVNRSASARGGRPRRKK